VVSALAPTILTGIPLNRRVLLGLVADQPGT
jgi:hypothetical protein